ncbi:DEKNAAC101848 [Brettanomyces naardenensis]|uniref:DEKNAAC101848 n=1 Tax=Brettanomyces naardenensis TaxID=13370 RepID=A0A448YJ66_BRENA|nr:DEKNAAC101848 [Brettanomyces naardenensis]
MSNSESRDLLQQAGEGTGSIQPPQQQSTQAQSQPDNIPSTFEANFQNELDKITAEIGVHTKGKESGEAEHSKQMDYLDPNLNYFARFNEDELDRHFDKIIGEKSGKVGKQVKELKGEVEQVKKDDVEGVSREGERLPKDDIDKELEMFQRVQEEIQEEAKREDSKKGEIYEEQKSEYGTTVDTASDPLPPPPTSHTASSSQPSSHPASPGFANTSTTTYKGLSIPSNSELVKNRESSVLKAYKRLLEGNETVRRPIDVASAQLAALPLTITAPEHMSFNVQMLVNTLPVLDNLATQILRIIAQGPFQKVMELVSNRESYSGISFGNLVELFETTKRVYNSEENPFFTVENVTFGLWKFGEAAPEFLRGKEETVEGTLRKVNLATFLLATLGLIDLGFFFLNEAFLDVFCPPQNLDPSKSISYLHQEDTLQSTLPEASAQPVRSTTHNQTKFLKSQAILFLELKTQAFISAIELGDRSKQEIIQDLFPDNIDEILMRRKDSAYDATKAKLARNSTFFTPAELDFLKRCDSRRKNLLEVKDDSSLMETYEWMKFLNDLLEYVSKNVGFLIWGPKGKISGELDRHSVAGFKELKRALHEAKSEEKTAQASVDEVESDDTSGTSDYTSSRKRQRQNRPTTFRRTWTREEEDALREGLKLKGSHWTAILGLYGPGGSVNEALKDRTSLQLKDKARNWKLYFLKNNLEVPDYLSKATKGKKERVIENEGESELQRPKTGNRNSNIQTSINRGTSKRDEDVNDEFKNLVAQAFN